MSFGEKYCLEGFLWLKEERIKHLSERKSRWKERCLDSRSSEAKLRIELSEVRAKNHKLKLRVEELEKMIALKEDLEVSFNEETQKK